MRFFWACLATAALWIGVMCSAAWANDPAGEDIFEPASIRADFEALYSGLQEAHYDLYVHTPKAEYDRLYLETLASFDAPLSLSEVRARFQRFVAAGRVAHASIAFPSDSYGAYRQAGGKAIPFTISVIAGRTYIGDDYSGLSEIDPGDEIIALNGVPMSAWRARLARNISADNDYLSDALLELMFRPLLWLEDGAVDRFEVVVRDPQDQTSHVVVPARTTAEMEVEADATSQQGTLVLDTENRIARMLDGGVAYLRPGPFFNATPDESSFDGTRFRAFIDDAFDQFIGAGASDLVIDLRQNPGGHSSFSDHMIAWFADEPFRFASDFRIRLSPQAIAANAERLRTQTDASDTTSQELADAYARSRTGEIIRYQIPFAQPRQGRRFDAKVWVLVSRHTFSNAVSVAAITQDYGFGTVIGEPTADLATTYAAAESFTLPATNTVVSFPKAHIVRPNGDERAGGVDPDLAIVTPVIQSADDPVLLAALRLIVEHR